MQAANAPLHSPQKGVFPCLGKGVAKACQPIFLGAFLNFPALNLHYPNAQMPKYGCTSVPAPPARPRLRGTPKKGHAPKISKAQAGFPSHGVSLKSLQKKGITCSGLAGMHVQVAQPFATSIHQFLCFLLCFLPASFLGWGQPRIGCFGFCQSVLGYLRPQSVLLPRQARPFCVA